MHCMLAFFSSLQGDKVRCFFQAFIGSEKRVMVVIVVFSAPLPPHPSSMIFVLWISTWGLTERCDAYGTKALDELW